MTAPRGLALAARARGAEPPEARGLAATDVRLLVAKGDDGGRPRPLQRPAPLPEPGDLVVVNTSATLPAALPARPEGRRLGYTSRPELPAASGSSSCAAAGPAPSADAPPAGAGLDLPGGGADAARPVPPAAVGSGWPGSTLDPLRLPRRARPADPLRLRPREWPIDTYQNVYAHEPGSAEMPSAGAAVHAEMINRLVANGVGVAPLVLHTGVSSLEPTSRRTRSATACPPTPPHSSTPPTLGRPGDRRRHHRRARPGDGRRERRRRAPGEGWTELVITPERGVRAVDGLLTGWHEPEASHLRLLEAVAGRELIEQSYERGPRRGTCGTSSATST